MWHSARKQDKAVKGLMFDMRKQALRKAELRSVKVACLVLARPLTRLV